MHDSYNPDREAVYKPAYRDLNRELNCDAHHHTCGFLYSSQRADQPIELTNVFCIGRSIDSDLALNDEAIFEEHCRIHSCPEGFHLHVTDPMGQVLLNGISVRDADLREGDALVVHCHHFTFSHFNRTQVRKIGLYSKNKAWDSQLGLLENVSQSKYPVLLLGPSGCGKEIISEAVHKSSSRCEGPLVKVNCSALSESLVESELFGHVKGSYTGAGHDRKGAFESARGGTLFLDEIGDLPISMQAKLLRSLENSEVRPVGSDRTIRTDVRILAATHQDLKEKVQLGEFRADLYFRLNVICIHIPPLSNRMEDFDDLLYKFAKKMKVRLSYGAIQKLKKHSWPGNIRELKNTVARASALFPNILITENEVTKIIDIDLSREAEEKRKKEQLPMIKEIERQMIIQHLINNNGNQRKTALQLGIPKSTLNDRIRSYKIDPSTFRKPFPLPIG